MASQAASKLTGTMKKATTGLRRINLEGLQWRVFDAKGQERILQDQMAREPTEVIRKSVIRMFPRNKLHDVRFYFGPRKEAENITRQQAFIRQQASADLEIPPREVREMRPHGRQAMIRALKKAEQQLQSGNDSKKCKKRESKEEGNDTA